MKALEKAKEKIADLMYSWDDKPRKDESHFRMADRILNLKVGQYTIGELIELDEKIGKILDA